MFIIDDEHLECNSSSSKAHLVYGVKHEGVPGGHDCSRQYSSH